MAEQKNIQKGSADSKAIFIFIIVLLVLIIIVQGLFIYKKGLLAQPKMSSFRISTGYPEEEIKHIDQLFEEIFDDEFFSTRPLVTVPGPWQGLSRIHKILLDKFNPVTDQEWLSGITGKGELPGQLPEIEYRIKIKDAQKYKIVYIIFPQELPADIKICVKNRMISLSGQISEECKRKAGGKEEERRYELKFCRLFPVPEGVLEKEHQIIKKKKKLLIKFKKTARRSLEEGNFYVRKRYGLLGSGQEDG